jgi:ABC-type dipeptide/oligopeptide/nickel transport system permease subunit
MRVLAGATLRLAFGTLVAAWFAGASLFYAEASNRRALADTHIDHTYEPPSNAMLAKWTDRRPDAVREHEEDASRYGEGEEPPLGAEPVDPARSGPPVRAGRRESLRSLFGTDGTGRSVALLVASAPAFYLGPLVLYAAIAVTIMVTLGCTAALVRGPAGDVSRVLVQVNHALPQLIVLLAALALSGLSVVAFAIALGVTSGVARSILVTNKIHAVWSGGFRDGMRELGIGAWGVLVRHLLLGHLRALILVQIPFLFAELILIEACLGYLHHPVRMPLSYGGMLAGAIRNLALGTDWLFVFPAAAIVTCIWGFTALGSGLSRLFTERNPHSL